MTCQRCMERQNALAKIHRSDIEIWQWIQGQGLMRQLLGVIRGNPSTTYAGADTNEAHCGCPCHDKALGVVRSDA